MMVRGLHWRPSREPVGGVRKPVAGAVRERAVRSPRHLVGGNGSIRHSDAILVVPLCHGTSRGVQRDPLCTQLPLVASVSAMWCSMEFMPQNISVPTGTHAPFDPRRNNIGICFDCGGRKGDSTNALHVPDSGRPGSSESPEGGTSAPPASQHKAYRLVMNAIPNLDRRQVSVSSWQQG
eukprot:scaffold908_cov333-Prasinococcus_capsulatus_cf.AAC.4